MTSKLHAHFEKMQDMARRFIEPITYVDVDGAQYPEPSTLEDSQERRASMKSAFINDIIYMLDGPEQREAQS